MKRYDTLVFIGRFQPFHNAHLEIVKEAAKLADRVIVIVGSANRPRSYKNPFTSEERASLIYQATEKYRLPVEVMEVNDYPYNDQAWLRDVQLAVKPYWTADGVAIIGHEKDSSSSYLRMFPSYGFHSMPLIEPLSAISIRDLFFKESCNMNFIKSVVPPTVFNFLEEFRSEPEYTAIINEKNFIEKYKKQFSSLPYPPVFVTTDAVVLCQGHVLLVKRKAYPGVGLSALPGGFLDVEGDKTLVDCAIRELKEETGVKVPVAVLKGSIKESRVFDSPDRSSRGRTITHAFKIELPDKELPAVRGGDDAEKAFWLPLGSLDSRYMFEDHYDIIKTFVGS